jgi:hypothetical protein
MRKENGRKRNKDGTRNEDPAQHSYNLQIRARENVLKEGKVVRPRGRTDGTRG